MNFLDTNHSYGRWPWTQAGSTSASELRDHLAAEGIAEAWVASTDALLAEDIGHAEERMFRDLDGLENIRFVRTLNPAQGGSAAMYRAALADERCVAVRLAPSLHHYHLFDECVNALGEVMQAEATFLCKSYTDSMTSVTGCRSWRPRNRSRWTLSAWPSASRACASSSRVRPTARLR